MDITYFFPLIAAGVLLYVVVRIVRYGGLKAAIFGGRIMRTAGEIKFRKGAITRVVRVHTIDGDDGERVVIEHTSRTFLAFSMNPLPLTMDQAGQLIRLLEEAVGREGRRPQPRPS
ncbi:MAG: hypothetical protein ACOC9T_00640 [Myxococcota bacterium]